MFPVAGIQKLAGGDTDEPYKGKRGQERWQKMRENVVKEWEVEQAKKASEAQSTQHVHPKEEDATAPQKGTEECIATEASPRDAEEEKHAEGKDMKVEVGTLHRLKDKLFKK